uniref:MADF domain-containing protein n=1 Tax=Ceratitis capitata TaxID=7213 RepID=W8CAE8_CERCA
MMDSLQDHKFNIRLVKTVKKYPVIYDCNIKGYKKIPCVLLRRKAWKSIGKELNCDPKTLHQKWHQFRKYFSHVMLLKQRGENAPYYLSEHLKFLIPYLKNTNESVASNTSIKGIKDDDKGKEKREVKQYETDAYQSGDENITAEEVDEMDQDLMHLDNYSNDEVVSNEADVEVTKPHYSQNRRSEVVHNRSVALPPTHVASSCLGNIDIEQLAADGDPKLQFLLSLLPDLNVMSNSQMRYFKCKVQEYVGEILN